MSIITSDAFGPTYRALPEIQGNPFGDGFQDPAAPKKGDATEKQIGFLRKLMDERELPYTEDVLAKLGKRDASALIDTLLKTPKPVKTPAAPAPRPRSTSPEVTEGMYRNPQTGEIFKVQRAVHGSGHPYAKVLVVETDEETGEHFASFEMARGMVYRLKAEWKLTLEEAKAFGALYGTCCVCARTLTDEKSIEAGIGPICAGKF